MIVKKGEHCQLVLVTTRSTVSMMTRLSISMIQHTTVRCATSAPQLIGCTFDDRASNICPSSRSIKKRFTNRQIRGASSFIPPDRQFTTGHPERAMVYPEMPKQSLATTPQLKPRPIYMNGDIIKINNVYRTFVCDRSSYYSERGIIEQMTEYNTSYMYYDMINTTDCDGKVIFCIDGNMKNAKYNSDMMIVWRETVGWVLY